MSIEALIMNKKASFAKTLCFMFSGKAHVGKTTCAEILTKIAKEDGLNVGIFPIATKVKLIARDFGWLGEKDERGRKLLQDIGNIGRSFDEDVFIKSCTNSIERSERYPYDVVILDDWRFTNEFLFVKNTQLLYKPITIRVQSSVRGGLDGNLGEDVSETSLDEFSFMYTVDNNYEHQTDLYPVLYDMYAQESLNNMIKY